MSDEAVILQPGRDKAVRNRHHWLFSGAIRHLPDLEDGAVLPVRSAEGDHLGYGYFNRHSSIIGRMLSFDRTPGEEAVRQNLEAALALRRLFFDETTDNAYRLVNGEGDRLPGLVVDKYDDVLVVQVATLGMDKLKGIVLDWLKTTFAPRTVYEKSTLPSRGEEGLDEYEGVLAGELLDRVRIREDGLEFWVDLLRSQKTGFFLDQRESRRLVRGLARGRRVLNAFGYTGAFSVCALKGGAAAVDTVDTSEPALLLAEENFELNALPSNAGAFFAADVFDFLRDEGPEYDLIILDPPAFAKRKADVVPACRGYKDINRLALRRAAPGGLVLTFSCSHFVDETLFRKVVFEAAVEAGRRVRILQRHHQAYDHPVNVFHPETEYLKGYLLYVD
jgi:23S rRNA (cytosine1962-C5)-methyltransferase